MLTQLIILSGQTVFFWLLAIFFTTEENAGH